MSRYSPTVLPQPFNLGAALDRAMQGLDEARAAKRQKRLDTQQETIFTEGQQDRRDAQANQVAEQLSRPGARTLADFLHENMGTPDERAAPTTEGDYKADAQANSPLTPDALSRVGNAGDTDALPSIMRFKAPPPEGAILPGGPGATLPGGVRLPIPQMVPQRAPVMTAEGVVMDPSAARRENTLSAVLDAQMKRATSPYQPYTREETLGDEDEKTKRRLALEEEHYRNMIPLYGAAARERAVGGGLLDPNTNRRTSTAGAGKDLSLDAVEKQIKDTNTEINVALRTAYPPGLGATQAERDAYNEQLTWIDDLRQRADSLEGVRSTMVSRLPGVGAAAAATPAAAPRAGRRPGQVNGPKGAVPAAVPEPDAGSGNAQADRWEELVRSGVPKDSATAQVKREYKLK